LYLALFAISLWAVLRPRPETFRLVGKAWLVFSIPHLMFHAAHLGLFPAPDAASNVVTPRWSSGSCRADVAAASPKRNTKERVQLAREVRARVIGTGRAVGRETALGLGADAFLDLQSDRLEDAGEVDVVFDVIGGDVLGRSAALVRSGGTLVTIATPPKVQPRDGRAAFFVVEPDYARLADLAQRLRDGRLKPIVGAVRTLPETPSAFAPDRRTAGKAIIRVTEG
jgi:zinc-binding alcohol dehydrogenase family protein